MGKNIVSANIYLTWFLTEKSVWHTFQLNVVAVSQVQHIVSNLASDGDVFAVAVDEGYVDTEM